MKRIFILISFIGYGSFAQEVKDTIAINEVSLLDNRLNTAISKENRNVYVLDKNQIDRLPAKTIQEVLQYASGIDLRQRGPFGAQADVSMDGGSFEQTLILLNGTKVIDHQTAHNALNLPIPLEAVERIEVIRGPAARIYGNNSLTGVINIVTRQPKRNGWYGHAYIGSNFEKDQEDTKDIFSNRGIQMGGTIAKENHQHQLFVSHETGNGTRYNTAFENNKLYYQTHYQFNTKHQITASYGYVKNAFGANGFYAAPGDKDSKEIVETSMVILQAKNQLSNRWKIQPRFSYRYNFDDYRYFKQDISRARSKHYANAFSGELNATYDGNAGKLGFGAEYRNEQINSTSIQSHTRDNLGLYAEYKTDLTSKLNVNAGAYINYNSQYQWQFFPGIDASYKIGSHLKIVGNVGTSQRIPSFTDLYLDQRPGNIGNSELKAEKAFQIEGGVKWTKSNWSVNAYYFYRKIDHFIDWIRQTTDQPWQANNFGDLKTNGLNAKVNYHYAWNKEQMVKVGLSYAYLDPKFKQTNTELASKYRIESLKHQWINTIDYQYKNFTLSLSNRYLTRQSYKSYAITDVRFNYRTFKNTTFYMDIQNVMNTSYNEVGAIPLPNRWLSFGVKFIGI